MRKPRSFRKRRSSRFIGPCLDRQWTRGDDDFAQHSQEMTFRSTQVAERHGETTDGLRKRRRQDPRPRRTCRWSTIMTPDEWYYARDNKRVGPHSLADLKRLAAAGILQPTDMVWRAGTTTWIVA